MSEPVPLDVRKADKKLWLIKVQPLPLQGTLLPVASLLSTSSWHRCPSMWRSTGKLQLRAPPAKLRASGRSWAACVLPAAVPRCFRKLTILTGASAGCACLSIWRSVANTCDTLTLCRRGAQASPDFQFTLANAQQAGLPREYSMRAQSGGAAAMHLLVERQGRTSAPAKPLVLLYSASSLSCSLIRTLASLFLPITHFLRAFCLDNLGSVRIKHSSHCKLRACALREP